MNMRNPSIFLLTLFLLGGCAPKRVKLGDPVIREGYGYKQTSQKGWLLFVQKSTEFEKAKKELGCGVCIVELIGQVYSIERLK